MRCRSCPVLLASLPACPTATFLPPLERSRALSVPLIFPPPLLLCRHEQALVEAYAADGWRGASREKVKPVAEIKRAKDQVGGEGRLLQYHQFSTCSITVLKGGVGSR